MSDIPNEDEVCSCINMYCPLPIMMMTKSLKNLASGQVLKLVATDPQSKYDIPMFAKQTGNEIVHSYEEDELFVFYIKRK